jgi:hypothetical protein
MSLGGFNSMDNVTLKGAVGASPSPNKPEDVKSIQTLLLKVRPPLQHQPKVTSSIDAVTRFAIREFQSRFMAKPDERVDPDGRTLFHLNEGFVSKYINCSPHQRKVLDKDLMRARDWMRTAVGAVSGTMTAETKRKLKNIYHIDPDIASDNGRVADLRARFTKLKVSLDEPFPLQCHAQRSVYGAWVVLSDDTGTMHFPSNHFEGSPEDRSERMIHERAHTVFHIGHAGMPPSGSVDFGKAQDDDNGFTYVQSIGNAYCYGWLVASLQPGYVSDGGAIIITAPTHPPKKK